MESTIKTIGTVLDVAEKHGLIDRLKELFSKERTILVLGTSGVGKSSLIKSLNGIIPEAIHYLTRTEIAKRHRIKLDGVKVKFVDTPGQQHHDSRRLAAIRESMKEDYLGVINVTSYGYHEHSTGLASAFKTDGEISEQFLEQHRDLEVASLQEWINLLGDPDTTKWFMTVVTKADLWWEKRDQVLSHYRNGAYNNELKGIKMLHPFAIGYCSVVHRFYGKGSISGTFDDGIRNTLRANFLQALVETAKID